MNTCTSVMNRLVAWLLAATTEDEGATWFTWYFRCDGLGPNKHVDRPWCTKADFPRESFETSRLWVLSHLEPS